MIVTVTMNPAIDKTADLDVMVHEGLNRLKHVVVDAGGKGINVSKTIQALGGKTVATGFLGGSGGAVIERVLKEQGIEQDFIWVDGETRTNLKIVETGGVLTEFNEPGPAVKEQDVEALMERLSAYAAEDVLFVLAGSVPAGVPMDVYQRMIERVHQKGAKVFLDADGDLFVKGMEAGPDLIKPNQFELEQYFGWKGHAAIKDLIQMGQKLQEKGIETVAVSMGKEGALFLSGEQIIRVPGLSVKAHSTVGAGDAMVAAYTYGVDQGMPVESCIRLSVASSAGAVMTIGTKPPKRELVDRLIPQVELEVKA